VVTDALETWEKRIPFGRRLGGSGSAVAGGGSRIVVGPLIALMGQRSLRLYAIGLYAIVSQTAKGSATKKR